MIRGASLLCLLQWAAAVEFLVIGGEYNHQSLQVFNTQHPNKNRILSDAMDAGILHHVSTTINDGATVVIAGGQQLEANPVDPTDIVYQRSKKVYFYDLRAEKLHEGIALNEVRSGAGLAHIRNDVFVCGGVEGRFGVNSTGRCVHSTCEVLREGSKFWTGRGVAPMKSKRGTFAMVTLSEKMYAIGGEVIGTKKCEVSGEEDSVLRSVEVYDPLKNRWDYTGSMQFRRFAHAAAVHEGAIYVCGGHSFIELGMGDVLAPCEMYKVMSKSWVVIGDSVRRRANHAMLAYGEYVYQIGGSTIPNDRSGQEFHATDHSLVSVERYSPRTDAWELLPCHLKQGAYATTAVVLTDAGKAEALTAAASALPKAIAALAAAALLSLL